MKARGFTLIELMVAVTILGIIALVAIPTYKSYVIRSNASAAQQVLMEIASRSEEYRLSSLKYPTDLGTGSGELNYTIPAEADQYYGFDLASNASATPPTYLIKATPKAGTVQEGQPVLTLNSAGIKGNW